MLAGVARIVEVCFIVPKYTPLSDTGSVSPPDDNNSEHTLADGAGSSTNLGLWKPVQAFRHLPPFVSALGVL